jgi:hypothetical protein
MRTHVLANNIVYLDLAPQEHLALAHTLYELMGRIDPTEIEGRLGLTAVDAYEFVYSVYLAEDSARTFGIAWLQDKGCSPAISTDAHPVVTILFTDDGSSWRLSIEQLGFIELCVAENWRRPRAYRLAS